MAITPSQLEILRQLFSDATPEQKSDFLSWVNRTPQAKTAPVAASTFDYVVWHNLVNFARGNEAEKETVMRDFVLIPCKVA